MAKRWRLMVASASMVLTGTMWLAGCYNFKIDTAQKWCEQIFGVNMENKYKPFWAIIFSASTEADAIRDDFVAMICLMR